MLTLRSLAMVIVAFGVAGCDQLGNSNEPSVDNCNEAPVGRIVFVQRDTSTAELVYQSFVYTVNTDGSDLKQLSFKDERFPCDHPHPEIDTCAPGFAYSPRWSPNGERIAFVESWGPDEGHIMMMNADGSNKHFLTPGGGYADSPRWSPDGDLILYRQRAYAGAVVGAFVMRADDGSNKTCIFCPKKPPITHHGDTLRLDDLQWGPTSDLLYVFNYPEPDESPLLFEAPTTIYLLRLSTRKIVRKIADLSLPTRTHDFNVAPDGSKMIFRKSNDGESIIYLASPIESKPRRITTGSKTEIRSATGDGRANWGDDSCSFVYTKYISSGGGEKLNLYNIFVFDTSQRKQDGRRLRKIRGPGFPDLLVPNAL